MEIMKLLVLSVFAGMLWTILFLHLLLNSEKLSKAKTFFSKLSLKSEMFAYSSFLWALVVLMGTAWINL